jgi:hypothetical protein
MDTNAISSRPGVSTVTTAPRPTPKPVRVHFSEVLAKSVVSGAESVVRALPGGPAMAIALRGGSASVPMSTTSLTRPATVGIPEGPGGAAPVAGIPGVTPGTTGAGATGDGGIEQSLAQNQEMNIYFLQIQEEVNAQNRAFSALSNVLKAEHDTVKTAIGNIR